MTSTKSKLILIIVASVALAIFGYRYFSKPVSNENTLNLHRDTSNLKSSFQDTAKNTPKKIHVNTSNNATIAPTYKAPSNSSSNAPSNSTKVESSVINGENINIGSGTQNIKK